MGIRFDMIGIFVNDLARMVEFYRDGHFDVVILSQTLQQTMDPPGVIRQMLRVGKRAIISFPNFGHWLVRLQLLAAGRMPHNRLLPYHWYNTPNVHLCTVKDFEEFCGREKLEIVEEIFLTPRYRPISGLLANWRAGLAIFQLQRAPPR